MEDKSLQIEQVFTDVYLEYHPMVTGYFRKRLGDSCDIEDLVQDVFLKLFSMAPMIRKEYVSYLVFTIARNLYIDYKRRFYKRYETLQDSVDEYLYSSNTTEEDLNYTELRNLQKEALEKLSPQKCKVYRLYIDNGYTCREMAEKLQLSVRTVEKHLLAGKAYVRQYIAACI